MNSFLTHNYCCLCYVCESYGKCDSKPDLDPCAIDPPIHNDCIFSGRGKHRAVRIHCPTEWPNGHYFDWVSIIIF